MHKAELEIFWQELMRCDGFADVLPGREWSIKGGKKRAFAASAGVSGLRYRYLIREGETAAVELQIETADSVANRRFVQLLERLKMEIEAAFGAQLDWNDDAELKPDRLRARIRFWLGDEPVPTDPAARRVLHVAMIQAMRRLIQTLRPYVNSIFQSV